MPSYSVVSQQKRVRFQQVTGRSQSAFDSFSIIDIKNTAY